MQHLKYIAHVTRRENSSLQKQFLFCEMSKSSSRKWKKFSELTMLDESQLRRKMFDKSEFQKSDNSDEPIRIKLKKTIFLDILRGLRGIRGD